jgi:hypothetical protein
MNIFHSPANSMLELFAPGKDLPLAMGLIAMVTELLYALQPVVVDIVEWIGATGTFITGGVLIILTGFIFRKTTRNAPFKRFDSDTKKSANNFLKVLMAGAISGTAAAIIENLFPDILEEKLGNLVHLNGRFLASAVLGIAALTALPFSMWVEKTGVAKALGIGLIAVFLCIGLVFLTSGIPSAIFCILAGLSFSIVSVSAFPFALYNLSPRHVTLGTGIFFGSTEIADGILNIWF